MRDALGSVQSVLVLGGTSDIALATCRLLAPRLERVVLAVRDPESAEVAAAGLRRAGVPTVECISFDATDFASHEQVVEKAWAGGDIDLVLVAFGLLGDQERCERDAAAAVEVVGTNFTGAVSCLVPAARRLRAQGQGTIVVLSSVAGERARRANFAYGSAKAGLDAFAQGLGDSLVGSGVHVMVVRPGFVDSKMTAGMRAQPLATTPEQVARAIRRGLARGSETIWVPGTLRFVMSAVRHLPRAVFRRLPF